MTDNIEAVHDRINGGHMRALTHAPSAPHGLAFAEVDEPAPRAEQAPVAVHASSINFGELAFMAERRPAGHVPGNDAAGVVVTAAADGSGPGVGTRVVGFAGVGAWAECVAIDTDQLAILPDDVDAGSAAALPAAATTALRALRGLGPVLGRRVLVTGASGGVGRFAVQLAARAGAHVVAAVGRPERAAGLGELGAAEVVVGLDGIAPVFGVLDNVGGPLLGEAFGKLERGGLLQSIGHASREPTVVDFEAQRLRVTGTRIEAFGVLHRRVRRRPLDPRRVAPGWRARPAGGLARRLGTRARSRRHDAGTPSEWQGRPRYHDRGNIITAKTSSGASGRSEPSSARPASAKRVRAPLGTTPRPSSKFFLPSSCATRLPSRRSRSFLRLSQYSS